MGRRVSLRRAVLVSGIAVALTLSMAGYTPAALAKASGGASAKSHDRSVPVSALKAPAAPAGKNPPRYVPSKLSWPSAGSAVVDLVVKPDGGRWGHATIGGLPVTVTSVTKTARPGAGGVAADVAAGAPNAPARVRVEVLDRAKTAKTKTPLAVRLSRVDGLSGGAVRVSLDYSAFHEVYGAGWSNRLGLVLLADCAVTTPDVPDCQSRTPLTSTVDATAMTVSSDVELAAAPLVDPDPAVVSPSPIDETGGPQSVGPVDPYEGSFPTATGPTGGGAVAGDEPIPSAPGGAVTAPDTAAGVVVALSAEPASENGDFTKTSLSQSASWSAGGSGAAFSWSYPIGVPPVPGGLSPDVTIGYSSASVDGMTAGSNEQTSWLGGGFDYQPGFIERSFMSCKDDAATSPASAPPYWAQLSDKPDPCWRAPNARLMWNGHSTELIPDDPGTAINTSRPLSWHLADDDGTKVEYLSDNGTGRTGYWRDERWRLTTADGTQYWFGLSYVPGTNAATGSVLGEAIMGNHSGEPCFSSTAYTDSWCKIAYRWNLDYVVDTHGNAMAYYYNREANAQLVYSNTSSYVGYYRAATLARIDYGLRAGSTAPAAGQVVFTTADRCWSDCATHGSNWPDTPWDQDCTTGVNPCGLPTFWSTQRLSTIETKVSDGGSSYRLVDSYAFGITSYGSGHTGSEPVVSLESIIHTGSDSGTGISGSAVTLPGTYFYYHPATQNRAVFDASTGAPDSWKFRLNQIRDGTGRQILISYYALDSRCVYQAGQSPPNPDDNNFLCFPKKYAPSGQTPVWTWWHKYRVSSVVEHDLTGASPDVTHSYSYSWRLTGLRSDGLPVGKSDASSVALWHHDMSVFSSARADQSWSQWAGYPAVTETTGTGATVSKTTRLYFTGMAADATDAGDTARVSVINDTETSHTALNDDAWRAGQLRETIVWNGATVVRKDFTDPVETMTGDRHWNTAWGSPATTKAYWTGTAATETRAAKSGGGVFTTRTENTIDLDASDGIYGNILKASRLGDTAMSNDDQCTLYTYKYNTSTPLVRYENAAGSAAAGVPVLTANGWDKFFTGGDFSGDGKLDLLAVKIADGSLWMFKGDGAGGFDAGTNINAAGWSQFNTLVSPGDFTNDGKADIIGRRASDGALLLYRGTGTGSFTGPETVGTGFAQFDLIFSVGDFASNGVGDLLARQPNGDLYLYSGNGSGGWTNGSGSLINTGWDAYTPFGYKDYSGNTTADIVAEGPGGLWVYNGNGNGTIGTRTALTGYGSVTANTSPFIAVGDITADGSKDLMALPVGHQTATVQETDTYAKPCTATPAYPADAIGFQRYFYDQPGSTTPSLSVRPWQGDVTRVEHADIHTGTAPNWITAADTVYDGYGRPTSVKDPYGKATTTAYTQTNGLTSQLVVTNPLGHQTTTTLAVGRGMPVTVTDPNSNTTTGSYDALGRMLKVWRPGHTAPAIPDAEYAYTLDNTANPQIVTAVYTTTKTLMPNGNQSTAYQILDGFLRTRQTQTPTADSKRTITDTVYDDRGLKVKASAFYNSTSGPSSTLVTAADTDLESQHRYTYDGLGRQVTDELWSQNIKQWNITTTTYDGERISIDSPTGGTDTTTIADALGRTVALWQYSGSTPTGPHTTTSYSYDHAGKLASVTGPDGAGWTYGYDLLGRKTSTADPDTGTSTTSYDNAGRVSWTKDGRNQYLSYDYDDLGRKTAEYKTQTKTAANQLAGWTYDTVTAGKGQPATATRYIGGNQVGGSAYTRTVTGYNAGYQPTHTQLTVPAAEGALAGTYTTDYTYLDDTNGAPATQSTTAKTGTADVGGLPAETLTFTYNSIGQQTGLASAQATYLDSAAYTFDGQLSEQILGAPGPQARHSFTYDPATRRALTSKTETGSASVWTNKAQDTYAYDQTGNITSIAGTSNGVSDQVECFTYDFLRRLTAAWTETNPPCDIAANQSAGADPYRYAWTYDAPNSDPLQSAGLRASETAYNPDGTTLYQSNYSYGAAGKPKHSLTTVTTTGAGAGTKTYDYDLAGNTTSRPSPGGAQQNLTWDDEGHLVKASDTADTTFLYDADGNRLIRHDPGNFTTLTLTDGTELRANGTGSVAGTRYYAGCATRTANTDASGNPTTGTTLIWNITDHHGTGTIAINPTTLQVDRRRSLPFGKPRGAQASGFGNKGFVGGTTDPTGLTHLGAREYDPTTGRFISVDPIFVGSDPQSWNGYTYSNNAPVTSSDPSGTQFCDDCVDGGGRDTPGKSGGSGSVGSGGSSGSSCDRGEHSGCALDGSISGVEGGENSLDPRRPSKGNPPAGSQPCPPGNAPHKCHNVWNMYNMLVAIACLKGLKLTCSAWSHYGSGHGKDYHLSSGETDVIVDDPSFSSSKDRILKELYYRAEMRCAALGKSSCSIGIDSLWQSAFLTDQDAAFGVGIVMFRITGVVQVQIGADGTRASGNYTVSLYKDWNFDAGKSAELHPTSFPDKIQVEIDLGQFGSMPAYGMANEYTMTGSSTSSFSDFIPK